MKHSLTISGGSREIWCVELICFIFFENWSKLCFLGFILFDGPCTFMFLSSRLDDLLDCGYLVFVNESDDLVPFCWICSVFLGNFVSSQNIWSTTSFIYLLRLLCSLLRLLFNLLCFLWSITDALIFVQNCEALRWYWCDLVSFPTISWKVCNLTFPPN